MKPKNLTIQVKVDASWSDVLKLALLRIIPIHDKITIQELIDKERR